MIASKIVSIIHSRGGRFLRRHKRNGVSWERGHFVWEEIDPQKSYEKACQALREGAPELRRKLQLSGSDDGDDSTHNTTAAISSSQANNNTREQRMQDTNTPAQVQSKDTGNDGTATSDGNSEDDRNDAMQDSGRS
mgnify:CR=1 FL=1